MRNSRRDLVQLVSRDCALDRHDSELNHNTSGICQDALIFGLLALVACLSQAPNAYGQVQSTISCAAGHGYWDVLSVMMMDPALASGYHMEGLTKGHPSAYIYTLWDPSQSKVYYVKNPQGNPWDINLYDSKYVYQWVTELDDWQGVNHWNDPTSCKKFNNGSSTEGANLSMRWAARCAVPGGENSSFWNPPPPAQSSNTNYYTYVDQVLESRPQNLGYSRLEVKPTGTMAITDHRANPPQQFSITTLPLQYTYSCSVSGNVNSCKFREVFEYGLDTTVNPVDNLKHSYGWVRWQYYTNSTSGDSAVTAKWVLANSSTSDHVMPGTVSIVFQCF
jgi:hypothetical protein